MNAQSAFHQCCLPAPHPAMYRDVLPRRKRQANAQFVQILVSPIPQLRRLGIGAFCTYLAICFQSAVEGKTEVEVPAQTWVKLSACLRTRRKWSDA